MLIVAFLYGHANGSIQGIPFRPYCLSPRLDSSVGMIGKVGMSPPTVLFIVGNIFYNCLIVEVSAFGIAVLR